MIKLKEDLRFANEPGFCLGMLAEIALQHLYGGENSRGFAVMASVYRTHSTTTKRLLDDPDVDMVALLEQPASFVVRPDAIDCHRFDWAARPIGANAAPMV